MKRLNLAAGCSVFALVAFGLPIAAFAGEDGRAGAAGLNGNQPFYLAVVIAILFFLGIAFTVRTLGRLRRKQMDDKQWELLKHSLITRPVLQMFTIVLILDAVLILAVVNVLDSQASATLLAAVVGYVLGSMQRSRTENGTDGATPREGPSD